MKCQRKKGDYSLAQLVSARQSANGPTSLGRYAGERWGEVSCQRVLRRGVPTSSGSVQPGVVICKPSTFFIQVKRQGREGRDSTPQSQWGGNRSWNCRGIVVMVEEEKGDEEWTDAEMHSQKLEPEAGRQPDKRQKHRGRRVHQVEERNEERRRAKQRIRVERGGRMNGMVGVVLDPGPRTKNQEPRTKKPGGPKDPRAKDGLVGWDHEPGSENREEEGRRMGEMGRHGGDGGWGRVEEGDESEDWSHRRARDDAREARASASRPTAGKREQSRARQVRSMGVLRIVHGDAKCTNCTPREMEYSIGTSRRHRCATSVKSQVDARSQPRVKSQEEPGARGQRPEGRGQGHRAPARCQPVR